MTRIDIPFNRPFHTGQELTYLQEALDSGHISGVGAFTQRCEGVLRELTGAKHALLTTSCTHALEIAAILLNIGPGDEVIILSFTFVSTANAFVARGATLRFMDSRPDTLNLDERQLPSLVSRYTKAIVAMHYAGVGCDMDAILRVAADANATVVEDNAHGLLGTYRGRPLGSFGSLAAQSFHETKNFSCGEGGALLVNDGHLIERAEIIREKGTDRTRFFRGEIDKYQWIDVGSSYAPSELLAAFLYAQLRGRQHIQARRRAIWTAYWQSLEPWASNYGIGVPAVPETCTHPFHMFYLLLPSTTVRNALIDYLRAAGILAVFHYVPLHLSPMGRRLGGRPGDCPVAENVSGRLVRLPFYMALTPTLQARVIDRVLSFPI